MPRVTVRAFAPALVMLAASLLILTGSAHAWPEGIVDVQTEDDAHAEYVAISGMGNSSAPIAVSAFGNASTPLACKLDLVFHITCLSLAGENASSHEQGHGTAVAVRGDAGGMTAVSLLGSSRTCDVSLKCTALSPLRNASGGMAIAPFGDVSGCPDGGSCNGISIFGNVSNCEARPDACSATSVSGNASSYDQAFSGTGAAQANNTAASGTGDASGRRAASVTGDATSSDCALLPCVSLSATGHASGGTAVSACDTLAANGRPEACTDWWRPQVEGLLP